MLLCLFGYRQLQAATASIGPSFFDSGIRITVSGESRDSVNFIRALASRGTSRRARTLDYMTGGQAMIADEAALELAREQRAPEVVTAEHREGKVLVRHWSSASLAAGSSEEFTRRAARAMHLVTTQVWPREPVSLQVDIYEMPEGAVYSLARKVQWKRGQPLQLAIFKTGSNAGSHSNVATHELYHVLAAVFRTGQWTPYARDRPNASSGFEEMAATLFASCGSLLADGYLDRPRANSYVVNGKPMKPPLSGEQVKQMLAWLRNADVRNATSRNGLMPGTMFGGVLDTTPVFHVFESGQERIELNSAQGDQLLGMCQEFTADPSNLEPWLETLG